MLDSMPIEHVVGLLVLIVLAEFICPLGQAVIAYYPTDEDPRDFRSFDALKSLGHYGPGEALLKIGAYGLAFILWHPKIDGGVYSVLILAAVAAVNTFYLGRKKSERF